MHDFSLFVAALIAGRIWWVQRKITGLKAGGKGRGSLAPAIIVIVESGAIYSVCLILLLSFYLSGIYAQYILLDAVQQVVVSDLFLLLPNCYP